MRLDGVLLTETARLKILRDMENEIETPIPTIPPSAPEPQETKPGADQDLRR